MKSKSKTNLNAEFIYGRNPVIEFLRSGLAVKEIYLMSGNNDARLLEISQMAENAGVAARHLPKNKLTEIIGHDKHQGAVAVAQLTEMVDPLELLDIAAFRQEAPLIAILDGIEDPHNLGAILRSVDGAGLHGVIAPKNRTAPLSGVVAKTSAGAIAHVKIAQATNLVRSMEELQEHGLWLVGADQDGEQNYQEFDFKGPIGIVVGAEGRGLHRLVKEKCDFLVKIPMFGKINSLNASVAAALLFFEARKQRASKE